MWRPAAGSTFRRVVDSPPDQDRLPPPPPPRPRGLAPPASGAPSDSNATPPALVLVKCRFHVRAISVSLPDDAECTSKFQDVLRKNMLYVEAVKLDVQASTQGRNIPIEVGQVGILCRHCRNIPPRNRPRGSMYFPHKLMSIYQSAQNMANHHYNQESGCPNASDEVNEALRLARRDKSVVYGGGQQYWARAAAESGLVETDQGLAFAGMFAAAGPISSSLSSSSSSSSSSAGGA